MKRSLQCLTACFLLGAAPVAHAADSKAAAAAEQVAKLTRGTAWKQVEAVPINFLTHHPARHGEDRRQLFVSSVEIKTPTKRFPQPVDGYDRDTGEGAGHLFKIDQKGNLVGELKLGEGSIYHPGRHRLRRQVHLGAGRRVSAQQPGDHLPGRSGDDEGDRDVPVQGPRRRRRPQHRRQLAARRQLGLAPLLSLAARRGWQAHQRRCQARGA